MKRGGTSGVRCSLRDGVAWITLARPRSGNRVDEAAARQQCDVAEEIELDEGVRLVVVTGSGRAFCLGTQDEGAWQERYEKQLWEDRDAYLDQLVS